MTDITIPAAALEAGAKALCAKAGYAWTVTPDVHAHWREQARAAFLAMIEAWEGAKTVRDDGRRQTYVLPALILPLPQENSDE